MERVRDFFKERYFGRNLPFNYRIYMIFFFECLFISLASATTNTLLHRGPMSVWFQWIFNVFCIVVMFFPIEARLKIMKPLLIFVSFVYLPFLFFHTAGYEGTAGLFSLLAAFLIAIVFSGRTRVALVLLSSSVWVAASVLQYNFPQIVVGHESAAAEFVDYIIAIALGISGIALLGAHVKKAFEDEQERIHLLLKNEECANKMLEDLTNRDPLTNTYNRRYLTRFLENALETGAQLCIITMDIDYFKQINDTWGHGFGDEVLVSFAATVQGILRKSDILSRTGGEEFVVALVGMPLKKTGEIAERIRQSVGEIGFSNGAGITVSIGLVQARPGEGIDQLLGRADKRLYEAKESGRNRIVVEE